MNTAINELIAHEGIEARLPLERKAQEEEYESTINNLGI